MRVLVATTAGEGHFGPLVPFARACVAAGHEVRVAAPASFAASVGRTGLTHLPVPDAPPDELGAIFGRLPQLSFDEANASVMRDVFAGVDARSVLPALTEAVAGWRPDLVVREPGEFASYVVAEQQDIPHVEVAIGMASFDVATLPLVDEQLRALGAERGTDGLWATPALSVVPEGLEDPALLGRRPVHRFRYEPPAPAGGGLPPAAEAAWAGAHADADAPLVYATFGTVAATAGMFPVLYRALLDAVADLPVRVLLTLGQVGEIAELGPLPANVHVERFWPQQDVMPSAAAVIGHGGFGTTMTTLAAGVPQVVLPLFALDQHHNAAAVARAGAGIAVDGFVAGTALPDPLVLAAAVPDALAALLAEPSYETAARGLADEMATLPAPSAAVGLFEELAG
jgi:UDP:flavonoid glycosyltransferase YjiC (YdhE family)